MNRQLRRANEKSDKRREREQERRKEGRRAARVVPAPREGAPAAPSDAATPAATSNNPRAAPGTRRQVLSVAYLVLVVGIILAQAFVPQQTDLLSLVVHALFYVILGYFLALQLFRRAVPRAFIVTVVAGVLLAALVEAAKLLTGAGAPEPLFIFLSLPGLFLGTWLGGFVHRQEAQ